jgi:sterol desaturase/sphingolipid hydroxylase (fatty acid hydroxylase superfamily)
LPAGVLRGSLDPALDETEVGLARTIAFCAALGLGACLERWFPQARLRGSWRVNGWLWLADALLVGAVCGACIYAAASWAARSGFGFLNAVALPAWLALCATLAGLDLVSYTWHRANHRVALLWRFHQVHHSDPSFTASTALRFHPGEILLSLPVRLAAVVLLGAPPRAVLAFELLFTVANIVEHANIRVAPRLERALVRLLVTPALHRRHHSVVRTELDSNFGTIFSVWDRLLRTYAASSSRQRFETGLPGGRVAATLREALLLPLRAALPS